MLEITAKGSTKGGMVLELARRRLDSTGMERSVETVEFLFL